MKNSLNLISVLLGLSILPISIYGSWLVYNHVKATELMWFIWWIQLPFTIISTVLGQVAKNLADKE